MIANGNVVRVNEMRRYKTPILVTLSFLLGWMFATNLTPIDRTCRIEDTDREYNIMKNSKLPDPELIILIMSAPKNLNRRNVIRETWLQFQENGLDNPLDESVNFKMKHYFVIGSLGLNVDEVLHLSSEQSKYNDILLLPMYDSYKNLTIKVLKSFEWLDEQYDYGLAFKYVLKCDDDTFVRLDNLSRELMNLEVLYLKSDLQNSLSLINDNLSPFLRTNVQLNERNSSRNSLQLYWGYFSGSAKIKLSGKWKETDWMVCDRYIPYALGGGYVLSKHLVSYVAKNAAILRMYNSEDISVGLWLAPVNNIIRIHDTRFDTEWRSRGCQNVYLVTHNIAMNEMKKRYNNLLKTHRMCSEETIMRNSYLYNWSKPPSQCCISKLDDKT